MTNSKLEIADEFVKRIIPNAKYMIRRGNYTTVYYLSEHTEIPKCHEYRFMQKDGKLYECTNTNSYEELVKNFSSTKETMEQLTLNL